MYTANGSQFTFCLLLASLYLQLSYGTQSWFTAQVANDDFVAVAIISGQVLISSRKYFGKRQRMNKEASGNGNLYCCIQLKIRYSGAVSCRPVGI